MVYRSMRNISRTASFSPLSALRPKKKRRVACAALALALIGAAVLLLPSTGDTRQPAQGSAPPPVPVHMATAELRDAPHESNGVGTVESLQHSTLRAQVDGVITSLPFKEGQSVRKGTLLATIDDRPFKAALAAAEAQLARDRALLRAAELDLARYTALLKSDAISRQQRDQQQAETDQLRAAVKLGQANVETAKVNLSYTRIVSPVDGRVGMRLVDAGNLVRASDTTGIVTVAQMHPISVVFPVSQRLLAEMKDMLKNSDSNVVEAFASDGRTVMATGHITALDNSIDSQTGTKRVRATFDNADERLTPGAFISLRIRTGTTAQAVVVPAVAVRPGISGHFVYRIQDNKAERVAVETGYTNDTFAVITKGIHAGDTVVVDGYSRLIPGAIVRDAAAIESASAP